MHYPGWEYMNMFMVSGGFVLILAMIGLLTAVMICRGHGVEQPLDQVDEEKAYALDEHASTMNQRKVFRKAHKAL